MHCGKQINEGAAFCSVCGKPQQQAAVSTDTVSTQVAVTSKPQGIAALDMPTLLETIRIANSVITQYMEALESEFVETLMYDRMWIHTIKNEEKTGKEDFLDFLEQNSYFGLKDNKVKVLVKILNGGGLKAESWTMDWSHCDKFFKQNNVFELYKEDRQLRCDKELNENANIGCVDLIPENYRYPLALDEIYSYLADHRAESWKEAVNLYEEQLHRWKLEENSEEALLLQAQTVALAGQASSRAGAAALFSGLNFFFK